MVQSFSSKVLATLPDPIHSAMKRGILLLFSSFASQFILQVVSRPSRRFELTEASSSNSPVTSEDISLHSYATSQQGPQRCSALHDAYSYIEDLIPQKQYRPNKRNAHETDSEYRDRYLVGLERFEKEQRKIMAGLDKLILANKTPHTLRDEVTAYFSEINFRNHEKHMATTEELAAMGYTKEQLRQLAPDDPVREQILDQVREMRKPKYKAGKYRTAYRRAKNEEERAAILSKAIKAGLPIEVVTRAKYTLWTRPMHPTNADDMAAVHALDSQPSIDNLPGNWLSLSQPGQESSRDTTLRRHIKSGQSSLHGA